MMTSLSYDEPLTPRILIADDQPDVLAALRLLLKGAGYQTEAVTSPAAALHAIAADAPDLVLLDLNYTRDTTSGAEGLDLIARIRALNRALPLVAMTAWGSIEMAVEAMRRGVGDFVLKPWENARLLETLRQQLARGREQRRAVEQERQSALLDADFAAARELQQSLLPRALPRLQGYDLAAAWRPLRGVSGDWFDCLQFNDHRAALCIADAMGKGVPAALMMASAQATLKACVAPDLAPPELCARVNRVACANLTAGRFITFFYGLLDTASGRLRYTNAGHNAPLLARGDGAVLSLASDDAALGAFPDWGYHEREIALRPGDRLALFTDGLTEARNQADEEFGETRLRDLLVAQRRLSAEQLQRRVLREVAAFTGGEFQDDATLLMLAAT
jgi:sigma-B regulation protein RsbU (phosphoserine phosphatase)